MGERQDWRAVRSDWREIVLVCRKCSKKLDGGFGADGGEALAKALRRALDGGEPRKTKARRRAVAVVEVGCLDLCPKKAVVAIRAAEPDRMVMVPKGADMAEVCRRLGLRRDRRAEGLDPDPSSPGGRDGSAQAPQLLMMRKE